MFSTVTTLSKKTLITSPANHVTPKLQVTGPGELHSVITVKLRYLGLSSSQGN